MKVNFIKHSCYTIETEDYFLVFDYIGESLNIPLNKKVIFFVSHRHADHFSEKIFDFNADYYVLSDDIENVKSKKDNIIYISMDNELKLFGLEIKTHGSTDEGVSFYVKANGIGIIHSGDLNYWMWPRYSKEEVEEMDRWFKGEVDKFKSEDVFIVMMPVDPRLNEYYSLTGEYFLDTIDAKHFFPMHMWEDFAISQKFKDEFQSKHPDKIIHVVHHDNDLTQFTL